jgi:hypothetical protein
VEIAQDATRSEGVDGLLGLIDDSRLRLPST